MESLVNENKNINEEVNDKVIDINIIEEDTKPNTSKEKKTIGGRIDDTLNWINEFLYNTVIYFGDVYMVFNELFDPIRNCIKSIYVIKFKMP